MRHYVSYDKNLTLQKCQCITDTLDPFSYLKFQEFWNIKSKGKNCDQYDIEGRMTASNSDPEWPTNGKIPFQTDSQCSEYRAYFGNVS